MGNTYSYAYRRTQKYSVIFYTIHLHRHTEEIGYTIVYCEKRLAVYFNYVALLQTCWNWYTLKRFTTRWLQSNINYIAFIVHLQAHIRNSGFNAVSKALSIRDDCLKVRFNCGMLFKYNYADYMGCIPFWGHI